ncbi:amidohydrolase [Sorangium cellulosum]|uniref:Amidohydrolase n=1 Tax=Sorangium cellulosum TaxID=56 RepID=A0A2L0EU04_SORCE|nr:amidohydrolase [Sorangium cellulosum]AUX42787.1 amidohydrolase [Sorangium cellulosum]
MPRRFGFSGSLLLGASLLLATSAASATTARTILHNGKIFTSDPENLWAEAVAVRGKRVLAVGSDAEVLGLAAPKTRIIDLGGRTVVPGLNDAHVHVLAPAGSPLNSPADFVPGPGPALPEVLDLITSGASTTPAGTWLVGFVGTAMFDDAQANRFAFDTVSPDHPVVLFAWTGHGTWLNSRAMEVLGIAEDEPDPFGGHYVRAQGSDVLTGEAHEYAEHQIRRKLYALLSDEELVAQYRRFAGKALRLGFTSLQDMAVGLPHDRALAVLRAADLPLRVRSICAPLSPGEGCEAGGDPGAMVRAAGIKWFTDGTPVERLACLSGSYADRPGWSGTFNLPEEPLAAIFDQGLRGSPRRNQLLFHAVGDSAIGRILDAMEASGGPDAWLGRRTRIEHGDLLLPSDIARARELGAVVVQNPTHLGLPHVFAERFTPEILGDVEPLATLLDEGIPLAFGTDGIGDVMSPFVDLLFATVHPTRREEALTLEDAVIAYTRGSAYAELEEHRKGTLAPGFFADLAVLSRDIFTAGSPEALAATTSELTMVGGEIVWDSGALAPGGEAR